MKLALVPILALVVLAIPPSAANVNTCTQGVCVYTWSFDSGSGSCAEGKPHYYSYRTARVSVQEGTKKHTLEIQSNCDAHNGTSVSQSSSFRVHYQTYDSAATQKWGYTHVDWYGTDKPSGSTCKITTWSYNHGPIPAGSSSNTCPAKPPQALPILP